MITGNRLVERCGRDPEKLCTPCEPDKYITSFGLNCLRCTQCIGRIQFYILTAIFAKRTVCSLREQMIFLICIILSTGLFFCMFIGIQFVVKACTTSSDTVCGCKGGYRCGNAKCSFCVTECKEGEELTENRKNRPSHINKLSSKTFLAVFCIIFISILSFYACRKV